MPKYLKWLGLGCLVLLVILALVLFIANKMSKGDGETGTTRSTGDISAVENSEPTVSKTTDEAQPESSIATIPLPQINIEDQPTVLTTLIESNGTTYEELAQKGCSQLICVVADGTSATIRFFAYSDGVWTEDKKLSCEGYVGRSGVEEDKTEGDGCTPSGLYGIGKAFYVKKEPETALDVFQITSDTYWVDDPDSQYYNQRVEGLEKKDWDSAEHMIDYAAYQYGFVVEYNLMAEYNRGSAIFFHIGSRPTAGCIATEQKKVLAYLAELDKERNPCVLILRVQ